MQNKSALIFYLTQRTESSRANSAAAGVVALNLTHTKKLITMNNKNNIWSKVINIVITVLTAIATTFGMTSCM